MILELDERHLLARVGHQLSVVHEWQVNVEAEHVANVVAAIWQLIARACGCSRGCLAGARVRGRLFYHQSRVSLAVRVVEYCALARSPRVAELVIAAGRLQIGQLLRPADAQRRGVRLLLDSHLEIPRAV